MSSLSLDSTSYIPESRVTGAISFYLTGQGALSLQDEKTKEVMDKLRKSFTFDACVANGRRKASKLEVVPLDRATAERENMGVAMTRFHPGVYGIGTISVYYRKDSADDRIASALCMEFANISFMDQFIEVDKKATAGEIPNCMEFVRQKERIEFHALNKALQMAGEVAELSEGQLRPWFAEETRSMAKDFDKYLEVADARGHVDRYKLDWCRITGNSYKDCGDESAEPGE